MSKRCDDEHKTGVLAFAILLDDQPLDTTPGYFEGALSAGDVGGVAKDEKGISNSARHNMQPSRASGTLHIKF